MGGKRVISYLLIAVVIVLTTTQTALTRQYERKAKETDCFLYGAVIAMAAFFFFWLQNGFALHGEGTLLLYSLGFGLSFAASYVGMFIALKNGSLALTTLVISYSLLIPTVYGLIWLGESLDVLSYVGLALLLVSFPLAYLEKGKPTITLKWIGGALLAFVGNGMCSTVQKMQQVAYDGAYKADFMMCALLMSFVLLLIGAALRNHLRWGDICAALPWGAAAGMANGMVNLLVMTLSAVVANAILFPSVAAGGLVLGFAVAVIFYKERHTFVQIAGYVLGTVAVVLLNL